MFDAHPMLPLNAVLLGVPVMVPGSGEDRRQQRGRGLSTACQINEGLNVIEQWNGANDFVFFARRGEL